MALSASKTSVQENTLEDIKLGLVIVRQLQIVVTIAERRDDVAVRRETPRFLVVVFLFKRRSESPAAEELNPTVNCIAIMHPLPTSDIAEIPCAAIHCRVWRPLYEMIRFCIKLKTRQMLRDHNSVLQA